LPTAEETLVKAGRSAYFYRQIFRAAAALRLGSPLSQRIETDMARKKPVGNAEFISFDVLYEDGARSSNRRVPSEILGGLDGDEPAKELIEEQDRKIAELSGKPRGPIKTISRAGK
jgi:hypothetical protein